MFNALFVFVFCCCCCCRVFFFGCLFVCFLWDGMREFSIQFSNLQVHNFYNLKIFHHPSIIYKTDRNFLLHNCSEQLRVQNLTIMCSVAAYYFFIIIIFSFEGAKGVVLRLGRFVISRSPFSLQNINFLSFTCFTCLRNLSYYQGTLHDVEEGIVFPLQIKIKQVYCFVLQAID